MNVIRINLPTDQAYNLMKLNFTQLRPTFSCFCRS